MKHIIVIILLTIFTSPLYAQTADLYRVEADKGNPVAQFSLGWCYANGKGVAQDYSLASLWYRKAAEQGNANAQCNLGWCYENGKGVAQDYSLAASWYKKAANQGNANAQCNLGLCYANGKGVAQDYSLATSWYQKAADQGNAIAQFNLGLCYNNGIGVVPNYELAASWYRKAADQGLPEAQDKLAWLYYLGSGVIRDRTMAFSLWQKAAEQGLASAYCMLGECYFKGEGTTKDTIAALDCLQKAAERNNSASLDELGDIYMFGNGVVQDVAKAISYYQKASDLGNGFATISLAKEYGYGIHVEQDIEKAKKLLLPLVSKGDKHAIKLFNSPDFGLKKSLAINNNTFAVVISNNECQNFLYDSSYRSDASVFESFCKMAFGIPENHIHLVENPSLANIIMEFDWLQKVMEAYDGAASALIYYAGPGISDESTLDSFLLPADCDATDPSSGLSLNELYEILGNMPTKSIMVFLDACFNGTNRSGEMLASARGVKIKAKNSIPTGNIVVFSASQKDETAWGDPEYDQGVFTRCLLNTIKDYQGDITLGELSQKVIADIKRRVIVEKGVPQTPVVLASPSLSDQWKNWKLIQ